MVLNSTSPLDSLIFKVLSKKSHLPLNELKLNVYMVHSTVLQRKLQGVCCQHLYDSCQHVEIFARCIL